MGYKRFLVKMREFKFVVENHTPDGKSIRHGKVKNTYVWSHGLAGNNPKSIMLIDPTKEISQRTVASAANDVWEGVESEQPDAEDEDACASTAESGVFTNHNKPWTIPVSVPTFDALILCAMNVLLLMMFILQ